jgi:hypothetical protein
MTLYFVYEYVCNFDWDEKRQIYWETGYVIKPAMTSFIREVLYLLNKLHYNGKIG